MEAQNSTRPLCRSDGTDAKRSSSPL